LTQVDGNILPELEDLRLDPGAMFMVLASKDVRLQSLEKLFLGDGSTIDIRVPGTVVTFKDGIDLGLTIGKNVKYNILSSPSAEINTRISKDASLVESTLIVYPGSSFIIDEGVTFTMGLGSTLDFGLLTTLPVEGETSPIAINGTLEIIADDPFTGSTLIGPSFTAPGALYQILVLGPKGKVILNNPETTASGIAASFQLGYATPAVGLVGSSGGGGYSYDWGTPDGAQIEINAEGLIIRDNDRTSGATVAVGRTAAILPNQSLTLKDNVTLTVRTFPLDLIGDTVENGGGAKLLGPGGLIVGGIRFTGGDDGWQAIGEIIRIVEDTGTATVRPASYAATAPSPLTATLSAVELGATIAVGTNTLNIAGGTTINLNGTLLRKLGEISLAATGNITLAPVATGVPAGVILTGVPGPASPVAKPLSTTGVSVVAGGTFNEIGVVGLAGANVALTSETLAVTTADADTTANTLPAGRLVSLTGGATYQGTVTAGTPVLPATLIYISSETVTAADTI
jgi:hypothetical protein